jgi:hypothetical protein
MSVAKETYLIYGIKFGEEFTEDFWEKDFYEDEVYWHKDNGKIKFLTDGMNGNYTFFGHIVELYAGDFYEDEIREFNPDNRPSAEEICEKFKTFYPGHEVKLTDVKLYYVPHYV